MRDHAAHRLAVEDANPCTAASELRTQVTFAGLLTGNGCSVVTRNGVRDPLELHRLDPNPVTPEAATEGEPVYQPVHLGEPNGPAPAAGQQMGGFFTDAGRPSGVIRSSRSLDTAAAPKIAALGSAATATAGPAAR